MKTIEIPRDLREKANPNWSHSLDGGLTSSVASESAIPSPGDILSASLATLWYLYLGGRDMINDRCYSN